MPTAHVWAYMQTHTHTQFLPPTHTHARLKHATKDLITFSKLWMAQCFPELCLLKPVTLIPTSLLKHTFIDTNGILRCPHIDSCCWQGMEVCRSGECWWALTPKGPVLGNSNNSEPAHASLLKKKKSLVAIAIVFLICFKWLSVELCCDTGQKLIYCFQLPRKKADHPGIEGKRHLNMEIQHCYKFLFVFGNIKLFEYLQRLVWLPKQWAIKLYTTLWIANV